MSSRSSLVARGPGHKVFELIRSIASHGQATHLQNWISVSCNKHRSVAADRNIVTQFTFPVLGFMMESLSQASFSVSYYYANLMLQEVARHEDFFHILLACITATIYQRELVDQNNTVVQRVLAHKIMGISSLRRRLLLPGAIYDDGMLLSIIELSHLEILNENTRAAVVHRRRVEMIIEGRGGISSLTIAPGVRALVELLVQAFHNQFFLIFHRFLVWTTESAPCRPSMLPLPSPTPGKNIDAIKILPLGFQELAWQGRLSCPMVLLIANRVTKSVPCLASVWSIPSTNSETASIGLTKTYPGLTAQDDTNGPALERLICLVLMRIQVGYAIVPAFRSPTCMSHSITLELTNIIPQRQISATNGEWECVLWIWLMTLDCWSADSPEAERWLRRLISRFPETSCWQLDDFEMLGERFMWTPHLSNVLRRNLCSSSTPISTCTEAQDLF